MFLHDVFISHSSIDDPTEFVTALRRFGLRIWYDRYEPMDDANWSSRVYIALRNSRSLLVFAGAGPLEEHAWVRFEVATADVAAKKANVERVFVAVGNMGARIPSWLINRPVIFQLDSSNSEDDSIKNCADKLRELNRVQFETLAPPLAELRERASSISPPSLAEFERAKMEPAYLERLRMYTDFAFLSTLKGNFAGHDDRAEITQAFYELCMMSSPFVSGSIESVEDANDAAVGVLVNDLALLAASSDLNDDTRGSPYVVLERLAKCGVVAAIEILKRCLRWEWSSTLVRDISSTLSNHLRYCGRDEAVLTIMKGDDTNDWQLKFLNKGDETVALRFHARRLMPGSVARLPPYKRFHELHARLALVVEKSSIADLELLLREAKDIVGISSAYGDSHIVIEQNLSPDTLSFLPKFVSTCVELWPRDGYIRLWRLDFCSHVIAPLTSLHHASESQSGASAAINAFITALETSLLHDENVLKNTARTRVTNPEVRWAHEELRIRKRSIHFLRKGAAVKRDGDSFEIEIYPKQHILQLMKWRHESRKRHALAELGEIEITNSDARNIILAWKNIPTN
jgi:hypothetical protein